MKVAPEILGRQEIADARLYGFQNILYSIVFDDEDEANEVKILLERLLVEKENEQA